MNPPAGPRRHGAAPRHAVDEYSLLSNEFATVRVAVDHSGNGPRLFVEDVETGASVLLSPLELASLCLADADDRRGWLRVGEYRDDRAAAGRPRHADDAEPA